MWLLALLTLLSEDLACLSTGALIAAGRMSWLEGTAGCAVGIFAGDMLFYLLGRTLGMRALRVPLLRKMIAESKVAEAKQWIEKRGLVAIWIARFVPGTRVPACFAAGVFELGVLRVASRLALGSVVWSALVVSVVVALGQRAEMLLRYWSQVAVVAVLALTLWLLFRKPIGRTWARWRRWEFWPAWAAYAPVVLYVLWLGVRYRSLTVFTAANPVIPNGGFVGESKSQILRRLDWESGTVARFSLVPAGLSIDDRIDAALRAMHLLGLEYPIVLKPDVGERGSGVRIIRSEAEVGAYFRKVERDTLVQEYVSGEEFGILYVRHPLQSQGRIFSLTRKRFPYVIGDGVSTVRQLIEADNRARLLLPTYLQYARRRADEVPAEGERVALTDVGNHCRGTIFLDGADLITPALTAAVETMASHAGEFYFGRFDVRAESEQALRCGEGLRVLELNGVSAEATHIYDPAISMWQAYGVLFEQWRLAFEIGAQNHARGVAEDSLWHLAGCIRGRWHRRSKQAAIAASGW